MGFTKSMDSSALTKSISTFPETTVALMPPSLSVFQFGATIPLRLFALELPHYKCLAAEHMNASKSILIRV
jgi:hypothetical protein